MELLELTIGVSIHRTEISFMWKLVFFGLQLHQTLHELL
jgi:hypothetical protein